MHDQLTQKLFRKKNVKLDDSQEKFYARVSECEDDEHCFQLDL